MPFISEHSPLVGNAAHHVKGPMGRLGKTEGVSETLQQSQDFHLSSKLSRSLKQFQNAGSTQSNLCLHIFISHALFELTSFDREKTNTHVDISREKTYRERLQEL